MKKINSSARYGSISLISIAVVLVILILLNMAVGLLPETSTSLTGEKTDVYKISKTSVDYIKELDEDITVYVVQLENSAGQYDLMIKKYVERYATLSKKITVKYVDPEIKPMFLESYNADGAIEEDLLDPSYTHLVVESGRRARIIPYSDIVKYALTEQELLAIYQTYGYIPDSVPISYEIENCLLSAVDYVTLEVVPKIYYTSTHKETALDSLFSYYANLENIELSAIDIEKEGSIPSDAQAVIIYAPQSDFSEKEIAALKKYADNGGNIVLSTEFYLELADRKLENLYGFIEEYYGMSYMDVLVHEGTEGRFLSTPPFVFVTMTDKVPSGLNSATYGSVLFKIPHAIGISEELPDGVTVDTLFTTTNKSYAKPNYNKDNEEKEDGDISGPFVIGAKSTRVTANGKSKLLWFSSTDALRATYNYRLQDSIHVAVYSLSESVGKRDIVSTVAMVIETDYLDISDKAATLWSWIIIAIVPGAILGYGIFVRIRRSRR
ncbi:MAG: hypothetical protein E7648_06715 [Ruminococcaceae bacterium]|nr:hypothetical protein [Oscillospiraceae bacterium]